MGTQWIGADPEFRIETNGKSEIGNRTLVFIPSSDRSGSTWLGYVLGSMPHSAFLGEFYRAWNSDLRETCAWCTGTAARFATFSAVSSSIKADQAYEILFSRTGKSILIDNSKRTM
jgi:hypothetical protein